VCSRLRKYIRKKTGKKINLNGRGGGESKREERGRWGWQGRGEATIACENGDFWGKRKKKKV